MPDAYPSMFRDHLADCYQACGLSPDGATQVANQQAPLSTADQAMLKAMVYDTTMEKKPPVTKLTPTPGTQLTPPPGTQTVPSQPNVVSMG